MRQIYCKGAVRSIHMKYIYSLITVLFFASFAANAADRPDYQSQYAGQEQRIIKSLSSDDIQQLRAGKGWGLAKAAELNGMPGPSHILQMKKKIGLTKNQERQVKALFNDMQQKAIPLGDELIKLEKKLNSSFANKTITTSELNRQLNAIAEVRKQLRFVHLATHLKTTKILTPNQTSEYNWLRGYHAGDPCKNVPEGHDASMWKKHNDCG
jgi:Spy/CpxP family protein refolding chaperone